MVRFVVQFGKVIGDRKVKGLIGDQGITNHWSRQKFDILVESESFSAAQFSHYVSSWREDENDYPRSYSGFHKYEEQIFWRPLTTA